MSSMYEMESRRNGAPLGRQPPRMERGSRALRGQSSLEARGRTEAYDDGMNQLVGRRRDVALPVVYRPWLLRQGLEDTPLGS